jgi:demethylmenaquinone methyltransferase/2-methoxy-6-polyprenyl-1,4-benzoquinol methylase
MEGVDPDRLVGEQVSYYRAIAAEYDDAVLRDRGEPERPELEAALARFAPRGSVLELAGGTGQWTAVLVRYATSLTVVDAAPEMLAINRANLASATIPIEYVEADLFAWEAPRRYDVVFFSSWLSHVPPTRFASFWELVVGCLAPEGRVFFVDEVSPVVEASDHVVGDIVERGVSLRRAFDGRRFTIVKVYRSPEQLTAQLLELGFLATVHRTRRGVCLFGEARLRP